MLEKFNFLVEKKEYWKIKPTRKSVHFDKTSQLLWTLISNTYAQTTIKNLRA